MPVAFQRAQDGKIWLQWAVILHYCLFVLFLLTITVSSAFPQAGENQNCTRVSACVPCSSLFPRTSRKDLPEDGATCIHTVRSLLNQSLCLRLWPLLPSELCPSISTYMGSGPLGFIFLARLQHLSSSHCWPAAGRSRAPSWTWI